VLGADELVRVLAVLEIVERDDRPAGLRHDRILRWLMTPMAITAPASSMLRATSGSQAGHVVLETTGSEGRSGRRPAT
jgi:hypothetical protein